MASPAPKVRYPRRWGIISRQAQETRLEWGGSEGSSAGQVTRTDIRSRLSGLQSSPIASHWILPGRLIIPLLLMRQLETWSFSDLPKVIQLVSGIRARSQLLPLDIFSPYSALRAFQGCLSSKESTCNTGDLGSIPGSGRSPGGGHGDPLQYSCLENAMD